MIQIEGIFGGGGIDGRYAWGVYDVAPAFFTKPTNNEATTVEDSYNDAILLTVSGSYAGFNKNLVEFANVFENGDIIAEVELSIPSKSTQTDFMMGFSHSSAVGLSQYYANMRVGLYLSVGSVYAIVDGATSKIGTFVGTDTFKASYDGETYRLFQNGAQIYSRVFSDSNLYVTHVQGSYLVPVRCRISKNDIPPNYYVVSDYISAYPEKDYKDGMYYKLFVGQGIKEDITAELLQTLDPDFIADNIAKDVDLFGLVGTRPDGAKVATGTLTGGDYTVTVTGLDFKPQNVMMVALSNNASFTGPPIAVYNNTVVHLNNKLYTRSATVTYTDGGFSVKDSTTTGSYQFRGTYRWVAWAN